MVYDHLFTCISLSVCDRVKYSYVATVLEVVRNVSDPHISHTLCVPHSLYTEAKFLDLIGAKVFLLAIQSNLY